MNNNILIDRKSLVERWFCAKNNLKMPKNGQKPKSQPKYRKIIWHN